MQCSRQGYCWSGSNPESSEMCGDVDVAGVQKEDERKLLIDAEEEAEDMSLESDAAAKYKCEVCGKGFTIPARLNRHFRTHTGVRPWKCDVCGKAFAVKENLSVHLRVHTKERPYSCDICGRAFEHSGKLHRHRRIHTGERPHRCPTCGKDFIQSGQLVIHQRSHTGEKPFVCPTCEKGFTCSKQLKVHQRTHTGEKPYTCNVCNKSFGYNHVLKFHLMSHYGEKYYKCTNCSESFVSRGLLKEHLKGCQISSKPSTSRDALSRTNPVSSENLPASTPGFLDAPQDRNSADLLLKSGSGVLAVSPGGSGVRVPSPRKDSAMRVSLSESGVSVITATGSGVRNVNPGSFPGNLVTGSGVSCSDYKTNDPSSMSNRLSVIDIAPRTPSPRAPHGFAIRAVNPGKSFYLSDVALRPQVHYGGSSSIVSSSLLSDCTMIPSLAPGTSYFHPNLPQNFDGLNDINHTQRSEICFNLPRIEVTSCRPSSSSTYPIAIVPDSHEDPSSFFSMNGHPSTNQDTKSIPFRKRSFKAFVDDSPGGSNRGPELLDPGPRIIGSPDSPGTGQTLGEQSPDPVSLRAQSVIMFAKKWKGDKESQQ